MSQLVEHLRHELRDPGIQDENLVTVLVDAPLLNGGVRLTVSEAHRIIDELSVFVEEHDRVGRNEVVRLRDM